MLITTNRLTIRPVEESDWKNAKRIWEDFSASQYVKYDGPHATQEEAVRQRISRWAGFSQSREHMFFAVCLHGEMIGYIACNIREDSYELGYCFHSDYAGKGYAKESHLALFEYLRSMGIKRLTVGTALNNIPSVRLLHSLGFQKIGEEKVSFYQDEEGKDIVFDGGIFELLL